MTVNILSITVWYGNKASSKRSHPSKISLRRLRPRAKIHLLLPQSENSTLFYKAYELYFLCRISKLGTKPTVLSRSFYSFPQPWKLLNTYILYGCQKGRLPKLTQEMSARKKNFHELRVCFKFLAKPVFPKTPQNIPTPRYHTKVSRLTYHLSSISFEFVSNFLRKPFFRKLPRAFVYKTQLRGTKLTYELTINYKMSLWDVFSTLCHGLKVPYLILDFLGRSYARNWGRVSPT